MNQAAPKRWWLWAALLAVLAGLVISDRPPSSPALVAQALVREVKRPESLAPAQQSAVSPSPVLHHELISRAQLIRRPQATLAVTDLFAGRQWQVLAVSDAPPKPSPAPPAVQAAPAVVTPASPPPPVFVYLGKRKDEQGWQVYLGRGEQVFILREGEVFEGGYRVETIRPPTMTLQQAGSPQQIAIGDGE